METVTENGWVYPGLSASIQHLFITYKMELDKRWIIEKLFCLVFDEE